jgi:tRNA pseudouridine synthase 10
MVRLKKVYCLHADLRTENLMVLHVMASAGTYIKEIVHGDLGRTTPNIGIILNKQVDILQLDVTQVYDSVDQVDCNDESWWDVDLC